MSRTEDFWKPYLEGETLKEIADKFDYSREWIRLVLNKEGLTQKEKKLHNEKRSARKRKLHLEKRRKKIIKKNFPGVTGGNYFEQKVYEKLIELGFHVIVFNSHSIIDLIVNGYRVDVKGAFKPSRFRKNVPDFQFRSRKHQTEYAEFFICTFEWENNDYYYIVPSKDWGGEITYISPKPVRKSRYEKYRNAWNLLKISFGE